MTLPPNEAPTVAERLRNTPAAGEPWLKRLLSEAADRIEALEAAAERNKTNYLVLLGAAGEAREAAEAERDALRTRVEEMGDLVGELHRLGLVLESAVRNADKPNHPAVLALIRRARSALSQEGRNG